MYSLSIYLSIVKIIDDTRKSPIIIGPVSIFFSQTGDTTVILRAESAALHKLTLYTYLSKEKIIDKQQTDRETKKKKRKQKKNIEIKIIQKS